MSAREIAGFLKPPTVHCARAGRAAARPGGLPAPKTLPTFTGQARPGAARHASTARAVSGVSGCAWRTRSSPTPPAVAVGKDRAGDHPVPAPRSRRARRHVPRPSPGRDHTGSRAASPSTSSPRESSSSISSARAPVKDSPAGTCSPPRPRPRGRGAQGRGDRRLLRLSAAVGRAQQPRAHPHHPGDRRTDRACQLSCPRSCSRRSFRSRRCSATRSGSPRPCRSSPRHAGSSSPSGSRGCPKRRSRRSRT